METGYLWGTSEVPLGHLWGTSGVPLGHLWGLLTSQPSSVRGRAGDKNFIFEHGELFIITSTVEHLELVPEGRVIM